MSKIGDVVEPKTAKKPTVNYVDNVRLYEEMKSWKIKYNAAKAADEELPRLNNYIGKCIQQIANGLSMRPNFSRYSYRDEMVAEAICSCVHAAKHFDHEKYFKPFAYFTRCCYHAFIYRIKAEKKSEYIKMIATENAVFSGDMFIGGEESGASPESQIDLDSPYYQGLKVMFTKPKKEKGDPSDGVGLEAFMADSEEEV